MKLVRRRIFYALLLSVFLFALLTLGACSESDDTASEMPCDLNGDGILAKVERDRCDSSSTGGPQQQDEQVDDAEITVDVSDTHNYAMFSLNVHDWVFPDRSIDAVRKTIEIHEEYGVPVDIYLTDPTLHNYVEMDPELVEMLKTSDVVSISYHFRPPHPAYNGFDYIGLADMDLDQLYETLLGYAEHRIDLESGGYIEEESGGYQFVKDTIGYAPLALGFSAGNNDIAVTLGEIYKDKGAFFYIVHGRDSEIGSKQFDLYLRPEHVEIKWYEDVNRYRYDGITAEEFIADEMEAYEGRKGIFVNIKMHENNYYTVGTPFWPVYWEDSDKSTPHEPPFDITAGEENIPIRPDDFQDAMWEWYESAVAYVAESPDEFIAVSNQDVREMIEAAEAQQ